MSLRPGLQGRSWVLLKHILGDLWLVLGLVAKAPILGLPGMSLQRIVRVSLEHPTSAVCVAGVETIVDIYG